MGENTGTKSAVQEIHTQNLTEKCRLKTVNGVCKLVNLTS